MTDLVPRSSTRLVGRGMQPRLGPFLGAFARRFLDPIPYPEDAAEKIAKLQERGVVVYVHRARNAAEHLALSRVIVRNGMPVPKFVGGLNVLPFQTLFGALGRPRGMRGAPKERGRKEEWLLQKCVRDGAAAELFLRRPLTLVTSSSSYRARYVEALISLQRNLDRPIFLVPHFLALRQRPRGLEPTVTDAVFGSGAEPGVIRAYARMVWASSGARWEVSDPVDLQAFVAERAEQSDAALAKRVRWSVLHHLARRERITHGPPTKPHHRMREDVLKDPNLQETITELTTTEGKSEDVLVREAGKMHDEIAARFDIDVARLLDLSLRVVWRMIYDGLEVDKDDIERLRETAQRGPLVLVPSHRSHVDYLVMSQVLMWHGFHPPLIAAGINLAFFPIGPLFRRGGAYFIRRSFKGQPLYAAVFKAYVKRLFKEKFPQEFFIEGGRSRTGKSLFPKLGVLAALVDAFLEGREPDALFVPANISYEKIVELGSYTRELKGAEKKKESASGLVGAAGVLRSKYGRVFVTFDQAISLKEFLADRGIDRETVTDDERRALVRALAVRIVYGINRAHVVTANALVIMVLLSFRRRGLDVELLDRTVSQLITHIARVSEGTPRFSPGLVEDPVAQAKRALKRLVEDGLVHEDKAAGRIFMRIDDDAHLSLDYYKNNIIHHLVPEALLAAAMRSLKAEPGKTLSIEETKARTLLLSRSMKFEFIYRVDVPFSILFRETLERVESYGLLTIDDDAKTITVPDNERARTMFDFAANLIANFIDTYRVVLENFPRAAADATDKKTLILKLLEDLRAAFLSGEMACSEAISKSNVENAINLVQDRGGLTWDESGKPMVDATWFEGEGADLLKVLNEAALRPA